MNARDQRLSVKTTDDFLRWNEGREGRREFVGGRIVEMMTGGSRRHAELFLALAVALKQAMSDPSLRTTAADYGVLTPAGVRFPDVVVHRGEGDGRDLATSAPILIAEILSPSSIALDFGAKAQEYAAIPSLRHYLVLAQDEPRVWFWDRGDGGFAEPEMIAGPEGTVALSAFAMSLSLADLYRGIA